MADYADLAWPDEVLRFKNNEANKKKLEKLVARITPESSLPFFPSKGIKQYILDHFHEKSSLPLNARYCILLSSYFII